MAGPRKLLDRKFYGLRRKLQRAEQVRVQAANRASSSPGGRQSKFESRRWAEQVLVQAAGTASSKSSSRQIHRNQEIPTQASPHHFVYPSIIQRKKITSWCRYCQLHRNRVKLRWTSAAERVQNQRPQSKLSQLFVRFLSSICTWTAAANYEGRPPAYSGLCSHITFLHGKPHSDTLTNYRTRERIFGFNPILRIQCLGYAR